MNTIRICPVCRNPLPPDAPAGLCPVCLLKTDPPANPASQGLSAEPVSSLKINPEAVVRVRYFGDYELQEEIARGGMGVVWKARQSSLNRTVALKMILAGKLAGEAEVQRFRREAEAAANLQHPNIVAIHEVGEHDGQHYYSMDYVEGRDLGALMRQSGPLPPARAAECLQTIAEAVHFAHQRGTLHRDLKPQNVLMDAAGAPHITDFGLAKFIERDDSLTQTGAAMGSPSYMPPEQAAGNLDQIGPHSDVYALGAILYELLTGQPPFRAETAMATMRQVMESDPVPPRKLNPAVPPDLETICLKCLEKNPARRYPSARALAEELGRFLKREPIQALRPSAIRKAENWLRRNPWALLAAASTVVMVLAGLLYWQYERVKFLQNRPLLTDQTIHQLVLLWPLQLEPWNQVALFADPIIFWALIIFQRYARGMPNLNQLFAQPTGWAPARPVSQRLRVVCGLIGVATLGFTMLYFAKLIRICVWESPHWGSPPILLAAFVSVFIELYCSLWLLFLVVQDYQKFVHGTPSRTLSAEQGESLLQALRDCESDSAIKLFRRTFADASRAEALHCVERLARGAANECQLKAINLYRKSYPNASLEEARAGSKKIADNYLAELKAKHPELFSPPRKPWDLNWRATGLCLIVELGGFTGFWWVMPPVVPVARLLFFVTGLLCCAGFIFTVRLKVAWQRLLGMTFTLPLTLPLLLLGTPWFSHEGIFYFGGFVCGAWMMLSGFTRKRRKYTRNKGSLTDLAPPL